MQTQQMIVFDSFVTVKFITGGEVEYADREEQDRQQTVESNMTSNEAYGLWHLHRREYK
jgi:hypothetical protein